MIDYKYEILKLLKNKGGNSDLSNILSELSKDVEVENMKSTKNSIISTLLSLDDPENEFINKLTLTAHAELSANLYNRNHNIDEDEISVNISLKSKGLEEYHRLDRIYNPVEIKHGDTFIVKDVGTFNHSSFNNNSGNQNQTSGESSVSNSNNTNPIKLKKAITTKTVVKIICSIIFVIAAIATIYEVFFKNH